MGLDEIRRKFAMYDVEGSTATLDVSERAALEDMLEYYSDVINKSDPVYDVKELNYTKDTITQFMKELPQFKNRKKFSIAGEFITDLVKNIYKKGEIVNLTIPDAVDKPLYRLGAHSKGLTYCIHGWSGHETGAGAENCAFYIQGHAGTYSGSHAKQSKFVVSGYTSTKAGHSSELCEFDLKGDVRADLAEEVFCANVRVRGSTTGDCGTHAKFSTFQIDGNAELDDNKLGGLGTFAKNSQFYVKGDAKGVGKQASKCHFEVEGDLGAGECFRAEDCEFEIGGSTEDFLGDQAERSKFFVKGNVGKKTGIKSFQCDYHIGGYAHAYLGEHSKECAYTVDDFADGAVGMYSKDCTFDIKGDAGPSMGTSLDKGVYHVGGGQVSGLVNPEAIIYIKGKKVWPESGLKKAWKWLKRKI